MYKGSYLFGNRIVTPKIHCGNSGKIARGSSLFLTDGENITRARTASTTLSQLIETENRLDEQYRQLRFDLSQYERIAAEKMETYTALLRSLKMCEYDKMCIAAEISRKTKHLERWAKGQQTKAEKGADGYRLNKTKVRDKCTAFFELERSRKFCAFYSVSFPKGNTEEQIYRVWNSFLTNLRKTYGLKDYLWVAEYQKNGTLHYHMIVNVFMDIRRVNRAMAIALFHQQMLGDVAIDRYNGVDVQRVTGSRDKLNSYLTKYVSKSESHNYKRAPWRCSQSVSALFTSVEIDAQTSLKLQQELAKLPCYVVENDFVTIEFFNVRQENGQWYNLPNFFRAKIRELNNMIVKQLDIERNEKIHRNSIQQGLQTLQVSQRDKAVSVGEVVQLSLFSGNCDKSLRQTDKAVC